MNHDRADDAGSGLLDRIAAAQPAVLRPLEMLAQTESGASVGSLAYNEVSLLRQTRQAAHPRIELNAQRRLDDIIRHRVLVATPPGSTASHFSATGPTPTSASTPASLPPYAARRRQRTGGARP